MKEAEWTAAEWNALYPVGTRVRYWPGIKKGQKPRRSKTRSEAWDLETNPPTPVVKVEGCAGGIGLSHVEVDS